MKTRSQTKRKIEAQMEIDGPSYDIFEWFPILVCQNVFKYLNGKDIIQASEVNTEWYKLSTEDQQVKKLKLKIEVRNQSNLNREAIAIVKSSKRNYQNIELYKLWYTDSKDWRKIRHVLAARKGSWKSVNLYCKQSYTRDMFIDLFRTIESSVEELSIKRIPFEEDPAGIADSTWTFPRLKTLYCFDWERDLLECFARCTSLVKFCCPSISDATRQDVLTLLHNSRNLKELILTYPDEELFAQTFQFKLKKLLIGRVCFEMTDSPNFFNFLEPHAETLELLELPVEIKQESLELILNMPRLSSLSVHCIPSFNCSQTMPVNTSIKHFKCYELDDGMLHYLAQTIPAVESLEVKFLIFTAPNIKKVIHVASNFQEPAGSNFATLVKLQKNSKQQEKC